jgi:hypothetical protein
MNQTTTFEQLVLNIQERIINESTNPTALVSILQDALKQAEDYEENWVASLYEQSEGFDPYIY